MKEQGKTKTASYKPSWLCIGAGLACLVLESITGAWWLTGAAVVLCLAGVVLTFVYLAKVL